MIVKYNLKSFVFALLRNKKFRLPAITGLLTFILVGSFFQLKYGTIDPAKIAIIDAQTKLEYEEEEEKLSTAKLQFLSEQSFKVGKDEFLLKEVDPKSIQQTSYLRVFVIEDKNDPKAYVRIGQKFKDKKSSVILTSILPSFPMVEKQIHLVFEMNEVAENRKKGEKIVTERINLSVTNPLPIESNYAITKIGAGEGFVSSTALKKAK